jgi:hypothetical protein
MTDLLKTIGGFMLAVFGLVAVVLVIFLFIADGVGLADKIYPWLILLCAIALAIFVFILLPLTIFRKTRAIAAAGGLRSFVPIRRNALSLELSDHVHAMGRIRGCGRASDGRSRRRSTCDSGHADKESLGIALQIVILLVLTFGTRTA